MVPSFQPGIETSRFGICRPSRLLSEFLPPSPMSIGGVRTAPPVFHKPPPPAFQLRSRSSHSARVASFFFFFPTAHLSETRELNTALKSLQTIAYAGQDGRWFRVRKRPRVHAAGAEAASQAISQKVENGLPAMQSAPRQGEPFENSMKKKKNTTCQLNQAKTPCV